MAAATTVPVDYHPQNNALRSYIRTIFEHEHGANWHQRMIDSLASGDTRFRSDADTLDTLDTGRLLTVIISNWALFGASLGPFERSLVFELRNTRNDWAHERRFLCKDAYRVFDSLERLITAFGPTCKNEARDASEMRKDIAMEMAMEIHQERQLAAVSLSSAATIPSLGGSSGGYLDSSQLTLQDALAQNAATFHSGMPFSGTAAHGAPAFSTFAMAQAQARPRDIAMDDAAPEAVPPPAAPWLSAATWESLL